MHGACPLPRLHPRDAGVRVQQVPAQEPAHLVRRHRHSGGQRWPPPQQARLHQPPHPSPHPEVECAQGQLVSKSL